MLDLRALSKVNASRCIRWHGPLGIMDWSPERWMTAITGEWGEAAEKLLDLSITPSRRKPGLYESLEAELADVIIYTELMGQRISFDLPGAVLGVDCYENLASDYKYFVKGTKHLGEAANALKKVFRVQDNIANVNSELRQIQTVEDGLIKVGNELTYFIGCITSIGDMHGLDLPSAIVNKFNSTSEKYGFPERLA